mmetsp:Transcript_2972/g.11366  ORF Transcript_2972/g.11366 Transcript_2972/m.11366 type:complete len:459 (-) Transcript_2972:265-1641(-)
MSTQQSSINQHTLRLLLSQFSDDTTPSSVLGCLRKLLYHLESCSRGEIKEADKDCPREARHTHDSSKVDHDLLHKLFLHIHKQSRNEVHMLQYVQGKLLATHSQLPSSFDLQTVHSYLLACAGDQQMALDLLLQGAEKPPVEDYEDNLILGAMKAEKCSSVQNEMLELLRAEEQYLQTLDRMHEADKKFNSYMDKYSNEMNDDEVILVSSTSNTTKTTTSDTITATFDHESALFKEKTLMDKWSLEEQLQKTQFFCQDEQKFLAEQKYHRYMLHRSNLFDMSAENIHFRIAESQFHRFLAAQMGSNYDVTNVEYIVNSKVREKFESARQRLAEKHGFMLESMKPVILFHGTSPENMESILKGNFLLSKVGSTTDAGYYGAGIYMSEFPGLSIGYTKGSNALILSMVIVGRAKKMVQVTMGCSLTQGFDSHISSCGQEVVIFDMDCILPLYKVSYSSRL